MTAPTHRTRRVALLDRQVAGVVLRLATRFQHVLRPAGRAADIGAPLRLVLAEQGVLARIVALFRFEHEAAAPVEVDAALGAAGIGEIMGDGALEPVVADAADGRFGARHADRVA